MQTVYCKVLLKTQDGLFETIEHELRSTGPKLVPLLATRCLSLWCYIWAEVNLTSLHTIAHYHSCGIDKYRHVEGPKCHNFGRLGISCFEKAGFCKTHPKAWRGSSTFVLSPEVIWSPTHARDLWYHQPVRGHLWLKIITSICKGRELLLVLVRVIIVAWLVP